MSVYHVMWWRHVELFGEGRQCGCERQSQDPGCDVGEALFRMLAKSISALGSRPTT